MLAHVYQYTMFADIASGNTGTADVLFLIAAILFGLAALIHIFGGGPAPANPPASRVGFWWTAALVDAGLCLGFIGFLLL